MRFRSLRPQYCSIYDPYFWWHERYWKLMAPLIGMLNGTPFKSPVWRLVGVRIGRRVFDDGCSIAERTLVTIGDECTLNAGSVIQCHSMEDGIFKADYTVLEDGSPSAPEPSSTTTSPWAGRTASARLLPHEGRKGATPRTVGRQPRPGDVMTRICKVPRARMAPPRSCR